jgi:DNA-directed RNA polymerase subunit RPC12/RpoP
VPDSANGHLKIYHEGENIVAIEFVCTNCKKTLRVPDEHLGKKARCPACQAIVIIQSTDLTDVGNLQNNETELRFLHPESAVSPERPSATKPNPYSIGSYPTSRQQSAPHRGGLILTLGILAFTCNLFLIPGIAAWVMGSSDLKQMKAGLMAREGETMTMIGMVLGIISVVFPLIMIVFYVVFALFMVIVGIGN